MKKSNVVSVALSVMLLTGCGSNTPLSSPNPVAVSGHKVVVVTDIGGINDQSFNQSAWEGLQRAGEEFSKDGSKMTVDYIESKQDADYIPNLENAVESGAEVIIAVGNKLNTAVQQMATDYSDKQFAIIDYDFQPSLPNVLSMTFKDNESAYLVGYLAGKMTKTNQVGFIGGMKNEVISRFEYGYRTGVAAANPDCKVMVQYADSFSDSAKGKMIGSQMYKSDCDIIFHAAGDVGTGLIEAAKELDKLAIGVDRDQGYLAPKNVLTSSLKRVDSATYNICKELVNGTYKTGKTVEYGVANEGVDIAQSDNIPKDLMDEIKNIKNKIINGEVKIPTNQQEFEQLQK